MSNVIAFLKSSAKAVTAAGVVAAAYLVGVFPSDVSLIEGFGDMTGLQWLGLVVFMGGAYGITYATPDTASPLRKRASGEHL